MTLLLHHRLASSGVPISLCSCRLGPSLDGLEQQQTDLEFYRLLFEYSPAMYGLYRVLFRDSEAVDRPGADVDLALGVAKSIRLRCPGVCAADCCSDRVFCCSAFCTMSKLKYCLVKQTEGFRRTDPISKPTILHVPWIPYNFWKIRRALVDVDKLDQFCVQMRVAERPVRHERVVEVFRVRGISLERMELRELGLRNEKPQGELG